MQKDIFQPELQNEKYITSLLFKLKSKAGALYSALGSFTLNGVNLTKLTKKQADYINVDVDGPYKPDLYRY